MLSIADDGRLTAGKNIACQDLRRCLSEVRDVLEDELRFFSTAGSLEIGQAIPLQKGHDAVLLLGIFVLHYSPLLETFRSPDLAVEGRVLAEVMSAHVKEKSWMVRLARDNTRCPARRPLGRPQ